MTDPRWGFADTRSREASGKNLHLLTSSSCVISRGHAPVCRRPTPCSIRRKMKPTGPVLILGAAALLGWSGAACSSNSEEAASDEAPITLPAYCAETPQDEVPEDLACTGLYADFATKKIA